ncbi:MAG: tRNA pseudouridine(13) synthase TruD [Nitrososphaeria archaeon]
MLKVRSEYTRLLDRPSRSGNSKCKFGAEYDLYWNRNAMLKVYLFTKESDFIVQEIFNCRKLSVDKRLQPRVLKKGSFVHFTLLKKNISTLDSLKIAADHFKISEKEIGCCVLKDEYAITVQMISAPYKKGMVSEYKFKKFILKNGVSSDKPLTITMHSGNYFTIIIKLKSNALANAIKLRKKLAFIRKKGLPNFYGVQRFGDNGINHLIGKAILFRDRDYAAKIWLTNLYYKSKIGTSIWENWGNWKKCMNIASNIHDWQVQSFLKRLDQNGDDCLDCFRSIPLGRFFIRSYSSYLFNLVLPKRLRDKNEVNTNLPILVYKTKASDLSGTYKQLISREKITLDMFKFKEYDNLTNEGSLRTSIFYPKNITLRKSTAKTLSLSFSNQSGSFVTVMLEFLFNYNYVKDSVCGTHV